MNPKPKVQKAPIKSRPLPGPEGDNAAAVLSLTCAGQDQQDPGPEFGVLKTRNPI